MTRREKLITKAWDNPKGLSLSEFQTLLSQCGWMLDHQTGSHQIWYSPGRYRLSVQEGRSGKAKGYQVEQFLVRQTYEQHWARKCHIDCGHPSAMYFAKRGRRPLRRVYSGLNLVIPFTAFRRKILLPPLGGSQSRLAFAGRLEINLPDYPCIVMGWNLKK
jgi:predicted RNA binding protein YcfA (HicA-like mRNA interferase family)